MVKLVTEFTEGGLNEAKVVLVSKEEGISVAIILSPDLPPAKGESDMWWLIRINPHGSISRYEGLPEELGLSTIADGMLTFSNEVL